MNTSVKQVLSSFSLEQIKIAKKLRNASMYHKNYSHHVRNFAGICGDCVRCDIKFLQALNGGKIKTILCAGILARHYGLSLRNICDVLAEMKMARKDLYRQQLKRCNIHEIYKGVDHLLAKLDYKLQQK